MAKKRPHRHPPSRSRLQAPPDPGPLDAALYVTYASEAALGLVEYSHAPSTQVIQGFTATVQEVSSRPSDPGENNDRALQLTREIFQQHDYREQPYLRVIGRVLHELLNHRQKETCSGGDVFYVLLKELRDELPATYQQTPQAGRDFNRTLHPGRRSVDKRLTKLKGGAFPYVTTTSITKGRAAHKGYTLTKLGKWMFDGWPELPELVLGRSRVT